MDDASSEQTVVPLDLLREITDGFSEERKIGSGSHGKVYLGVHPDGQKIAVKLIYDMPGVDDKQFQNEFKNLTRLRHRNIVRLVGYCHDIQEVQVKHEGKLVVAEKTYRALCLEYMSNGSLQNYLSDECDKYDWRTGYGIIRGICQGLKYLHHELKSPIYHLDLKPANVLLDENMVPRIADFGLSRLFGDEQTRATKSSLGTIGYLPPEYIRNNLISSKFDIFSLGVVIIKIVAGQSGCFNSADMSSQEFTNLVQEKWMNRLHETSDLTKAYSEQVKICIEIGLSCVQEDRHKRPTIQDIVDRLIETENECTYAARKNRLSIYQEVTGNTSSQYAQYPNDRHSEQIYHGSTSKRDIVATAHSNYYKENAGPREARLDDDSQFYGDDNQQYSAYGLGQHDPSMSHNGTTYYYLPLGKNMLNDQGLLVSARPTIPFHNFLSVPQDEMITDANLTGLGTSSLNHVPANISSGPLSVQARTTQGNIDGMGSFPAWSISPSHNFAPAEGNDSITGANPTAQRNAYLSSLTTATPGGLSQGTSSLNHDQAAILSGLYSIEVPGDALIAGASLTGQQIGYLDFWASYPLDEVGQGTYSTNHDQAAIFSGLPSTDFQEWPGVEESHVADQAPLYPLTLQRGRIPTHHGYT